MSETNVAQDQIKAYVDRILRMKEEAKAINADIREIYAEAKGNGFDKTVLGQLVSYVEKRQTDAATLAERSALFDLYLEAFDGSSGRPSHAHTRERASKLTYGDHLDDATKASVDAIASLRANPDMAIVDVANLKSQPSKTAGQAVTASEPVVTSPVESEAAEISTPDPVAKADDDVNAGGVDSPSVSREARPGKTAEAESVSRGGSDRALPATSEIMDATAGETAPVSETGKSVEAPASAAPASKYATPGEVVWETHPPEGVERGAISMAFGWAGQDSAVIADDLEKGKAQPIVKKGNVILDGWARYMAARNMRNLDGSPVAYPVVQYDGSDLLVDIIKLNVNGRILSEDDKRKIAANLARQEPSRKDDIYRAFELWMEPV